MGQNVSKTDFEWSLNAEPHQSRKIEILKKHPEIKQLFGPDPKFKYWVTFFVIFQIVSLFIVRNLSGISTFLFAYFVTGTINHVLTLAIHDIGHNLAFGQSYLKANRMMGMIANLPLIIPFSVSFRRYHFDHHKFLGHDQIDPDLPTKLEAQLFCTTFGKIIWLFLMPIFYIIRPIIIRPKNILPMEVVNIIVQFTFNVVILYFFGWDNLLYLMGSSLLAMGPLHPMAGHFISEHYMFKEGFETYSYYGILNCMSFDVGYHNEHHDFPYIASSRLHKVREIAPEFYNDLPHHTSWFKVLYTYVVDPAIGPYARVKRHQVGLDTTGKHD